MKTGVMIGTFDPLHGAHIGQLLRADKIVSFTKVYILVIKYPFHKPNATKWQHRLHMAKLTLEAYDLPFDYEVLTVENTLSQDFTHDVDYRISGIDSLLDDLADKERWVLAQRWPMIVLSIPGISQSSLDEALANLPDEAKQKIKYQYVSEKAAPMMNFDFDRQEFISERVHSTHLRGGKQDTLIPASVQAYIQERQLYKN